MNRFRRGLGIAGVMTLIGAGGSYVLQPDPPTCTGAACAQPASGAFSIPANGAATSSYKVINTGEFAFPAGDGTGNARFICNFSHMNYDDPIIYPGQKGQSHLHTFFGNQAMDWRATDRTALNRGASTCAGGIANRSGYWIPTMMTAAGQPIAPNFVIVYYKSGYQGIEVGSGRPRGDASQIQLPNGLKLIAGSPTSQVPQNTQNISFECAVAGTTGETLGQFGSSIPNCAAGTQIKGRVRFPQCWDGVNLDSADHKSHVVYGTFGSGCPTSHPVPLPEISYNIYWPVNSNSAGWRLSSDVQNGTPAGYSLHGDIWTGWNPAVKDAFLANCTRVNADCGVDKLGNGQRLTYPPA